MLTKEKIAELKKKTEEYSKKWSKEEIENMDLLIKEGLTNSKLIYKENIFPDRSLSCIQTKVYQRKVVLDKNANK